MKIGGRELGLGKRNSRLNKVSVSTVTTAVPTRTRVVGIGAGTVEVMGVKEAAGKRVEVAIVKPGVTPGVSQVRVLEPVAAVPVPEEFMEEGLTSPW